jgi:hypothetical protein
MPPKPIARTVLYKNVIDFYYNQLNSEERKTLFNWITESSNFDTSESLNQWFYARYNPDNQYKVTGKYMKDEHEIYNCFLKDGRYYLKIDNWISSEYITNIEKIN